MEHMRKTNHTRLPNYMTMIKHMTIRNKILMVITAVLMLCSVLITSVSVSYTHLTLPTIA